MNMHDLDLHGLTRLRNVAESARMKHQSQVRSLFKDGEQKVVGKLAVYPDQLAVCLMAKNRYRIDWGDGVVQNYQSGALAHHQYDFTQLRGGVCNKTGFKEVLVVITAQTRYHLTDLDLDPFEETHAVASANAHWLSLDLSMPNLRSFVLAKDKLQRRHPLLKHRFVV